MMIYCICQGYSNRTSFPLFMLLSIPTLATLINKCWCWFSYSWSCSTKDVEPSHGKHSLIYFQVSSRIPWIFFFFLEQTTSVFLTFVLCKSLYLFFFSPWTSQMLCFGLMIFFYKKGIRILVIMEADSSMSMSACS